MTDLAAPQAHTDPSTGTEAGAGAAEREVREVLAQKSAAIEDRRADRLVELYAPEVVVFDLAPPLAHPAAEVQDPVAKQSWFDGFDGRMGHTYRDLTVVVDGDLAVAHALVGWTATPRGASEGFTLWYRSTVSLRRLGGAWRISHEHESTPFHMDGSFRAAVDLQP